MVFKAAVCLAVLTCLAGPSLAQTRDPFERAPKGYELYSWPDSNGAWNFCILYGTNRKKVTEEVFSQKTLLHGLDQLERKIAGLSGGTRIFWANRIPSGSGPRSIGSERLAYPPLDIRERIIAYAKKYHIDVQVIDKTL